MRLTKNVAIRVFLTLPQHSGNLWALIVTDLIGPPKENETIPTPEELLLFLGITEQEIKLAKGGY